MARVNYESDPDMFKMNHHPDNLGQKSFCWKVFVRTHTYTHSQSTAQPGHTAVGKNRQQ